jgi:hypothetical protein
MDSLPPVAVSHSKSGIILGLAAFALLGCSGLIFTEIVRPFRDNNIDLPMAVGGCVLAASLSSAALSFHMGARVLNFIGLILSLLALFAVAFIFEALSHMRFM